MNTTRTILEQILEDVDDTIIDAWIAKLTNAGRDPVVYARALAMKAKRLDGCDGFFIAMHRKNAEDDWLGTYLRKAHSAAKPALNEAWPYPGGHWNCRSCSGRGWYALKPSHMDEAHQDRYDLHQDNGWAPTMYKDTGRITFICIECNPTGAPVEGGHSKNYPTYPVGGAPHDEEVQVPF